MDGARFNGTVSDNADVAISNSENMEIELDFPAGTKIDTALLTKISSLSIPKKGDSSLKYSLNIKNSTADGWGIGMFPQSDITIRDVEKSLVVTFIAAPPWYEKTVTFDDLKVKYYKDKTWNIGENTKLRLVNVKTNKWSPFATERNTLVIRNSELADMVNFSGYAKNIIENSTVTLVRAQENVQITLKNSTVEDDVIAKDNGVVTLINTKVGGEIVQEDNGKVIKK